MCYRGEAYGRGNTSSAAGYLSGVSKTGVGGGVSWGLGDLENGLYSFPFCLHLLYILSLSLSHFTFCFTFVFFVLLLLSLY